MYDTIRPKESVLLLDGKLVDTVFQNSFSAILGNLFVAIVVAAYYQNQIDQSYILIWLSVFLVVTLVRFLLKRLYEARHMSNMVLNPSQWLGLYAVGTFLVAMCWFAATYYVLMSLPITESLVLYVCTLGLVSAASGMLAGAWRVYAIFAGICLSPPLFLDFSVNPQYATLALLSIGFFVVTLTVSYKSSKVLETSIARQVANEQLMFSLQREKDQVLTLNARLKQDLRFKQRTAQQLLADKNEAEELAEKLFELSSNDALTGLANRRALDDQLTQEWARARRLGTVISLFIVDIDHFKLLNDHYGHHYGDECLVKVANALRNEVNRPTDFIARYGGEEFVVILPGTPLDAAMTIADRMRLAVEKVNMRHEYSPVKPCVTVSVGVACVVPKLDNQMDTLFQKTDEALYKAKRSGRNRVVSADNTAEIC